MENIYCGYMHKLIIEVIVIQYRLRYRHDYVQEVNGDICLDFIHLHTLVSLAFTRPDILIILSTFLKT